MKFVPPKFRSAEDLDQKIDRTFTRQELDELRETYERTGNGAHVWQAYRLLRDSDMPLEQWILEYFDAAADRLVDADSAGEIAAAIGYRNEQGGDHLGNNRADRQLLDTVALLQVYATEVDRMQRKAPGCCRSKNQIYKRMHEQGLGVSPGAIKKRLFELL